MAAPGGPPRFTQEYITLPYYPQAEVTPEAWREMVRLIEGYLQRIEGRVEALQDALGTLEARVTALE